MAGKIQTNAKLVPPLRERVEKALATNAAYRALPPAKRRQIASDTVRTLQFVLGDAATASAGASTSFVEAVDFPAFVSGLIDGVFHVIVDGSVQQMNAYGELIKKVAKTIDQFVADNVSDQSARDYLVDRYPKHFEIGSSGRVPKLKTRKGCSKADLLRCFADLGLEKPAAAFDGGNIEAMLLPAARRRMAADRQQLLATMVLMGINRLVT
jgi:hypothetical protein